MSSMAESKVTGIIKSLASLEDDLDSLTGKVSDMKKSLLIQSQSEIDKLMQKTRERATKEAEEKINQTRQKANAQSEKIVKEGEEKLENLKSQIDSNFDDAVKHVVSTVLKA